jgi:hypothetical protein
MCKTGLSPLSADEYRRGGMVPAFGNFGGHYGWHIIKRLA